MNDLNQPILTLKTRFDTNMQHVRDLCGYHQLVLTEAQGYLNRATVRASWLFDQIARDKMVDEWELDMLKKRAIKESFNIQLEPLCYLKTFLEEFHSNAQAGRHKETGLIFSQALVLLVSYFESSLRDLFKLGINDWFKQGGALPKLNGSQENALNFNLKEWWELRHNPDLFFERLSEKCRFGFQNMDKVTQAFKWLTIDLNDDSVRKLELDRIKSIITIRHSIAHEGVPPKKTSENRAKTDDSEKSTQLDIKLISDGIDAMTHVMDAVCKALSNKMNQNWNRAGR